MCTKSSNFSQFKSSFLEWFHFAALLLLIFKGFMFHFGYKLYSSAKSE